MAKSSVAVSILNFNGSKDTLECLDSIFKFDADFNGIIVILDNGSETSDYLQLKSGIQARLSEDKLVVFDNVPRALEEDVIDGKKVVLIRSADNYGFAIGNNIVMHLIQDTGFFDYVLLQNNDTVLVDDSITQLVAAMDRDSDCAVGSVDIRYYSEPSESWNAGGKIFAGTRKYYFRKDVERFKSKGEFFPRVTYLTGCFMMIRVGVLSTIGLLSNLFFFGEEDYEYAMRLRKAQLCERCLLSTYILHKVGRSSERALETGHVSRKFVHRLNRMIDMRRYYSALQWRIWRMFVFAYLRYRMSKSEGMNQRQISVYQKRLRKYSERYNGVSKELFLELYAKPDSFFVEDNDASGKSQ